MQFSPGPRTIKALGITSGGLDSILAALLLREQGIDVFWICFETPFFSSEAAIQSARSINIPIRTKDITDPYLEMLRSPQAGYGKNMNPCMDCHALMFHMAGAEMKQTGTDFLFSGEVVGQRLKSQTKNAMRYVEKHSGYDGYILRPLSARLLPETIPEKAGWVDRGKLGDISGRSRSRQIEMAAHFGVTAYPTPAGGCLLTDSNYSRRLRDLMSVQETFEKRELYLLKYGRHFRLAGKVKVIVGKSKKDNQEICSFYRKSADLLIRHASLPGPVVLMPAGCSRERAEAETGAAICAAYSRARTGDTADITITGPEGHRTVQVVTPPAAEFRHLMI